MARVRYQTIEIGDVDLHVRTLRDTNQYIDDGGVSEGFGISPAQWPLFGVVWPSGRVLAELMFDYDIGGRRVLEVGCGIGLASLMLNHREVDITATDRHPKAGVFLALNVALNQGRAIPFVRQGWREREIEASTSELIIGSDLLYEREQVALLSGFIDHCAAPECEVLVIDPGRGHQNHFIRAMQARGFEHEWRKPARQPEDERALKSRIHRFWRGVGK